MSDMPGMKKDDMANMPGMKKDDMSNMPGMSHQHSGIQMEMHSVTNIGDPMKRESSGTAWAPDSSPMYAKMKMYEDGGMLMLMGTASCVTRASVQHAMRRLPEREAEAVSMLRRCLWRCIQNR